MRYRDVQLRPHFGLHLGKSFLSSPAPVGRTDGLSGPFVILLHYECLDMGSRWLGGEAQGGRCSGTSPKALPLVLPPGLGYLSRGVTSGSLAEKGR